MDRWSPQGTAADVVAQVRSWLAGDLPGGADARLVITTSGSTGRPKQVVLSRSAVLASVRASAARLGATGPWALALPPTYVAGLQVIARSLVAGHEPVLLHDSPDAPGATGAEAGGGWPDGEGWFTSLVPTQLVRALRDPREVTALRRAHTVLLGGGPIDAGLRARAEDEGIRLVATYGAAETAGGCVYDGLPLDGVALALGEDGRIRIAGPTLFDGYLHDPELSATTLVDGWYLTSDAGRIDEDGRLAVLGRVDDVIVSGGVNVPGAVVARRLREHPDLGSDVAAVEVVGVEDPEWGREVVAFVAPVAPEVRLRTPSLEQLRDWIAESHPRSWAVRRVVALETMPLLANGKPDREQLRRIGGQR